MKLVETARFSPVDDVARRREFNPLLSKSKLHWITTMWRRIIHSLVFFIKFSFLHVSNQKILVLFKSMSSILFPSPVSGFDNPPLLADRPSYDRMNLPFTFFSFIYLFISPWFITGISIPGESFNDGKIIIFWVIGVGI